MKLEHWEAYLEDIENRGYITSPNGLVRRAMRMDGFSYNNVHNLEEYVRTAVDVIERWDDREELGSSDYTFLLKEYLEELGLKTEFSPTLTIIKEAA